MTESDNTGVVPDCGYVDLGALDAEREALAEILVDALIRWWTMHASTTDGGRDD